MRNFDRRSVRVSARAAVVPITGHVADLEAIDRRTRHLAITGEAPLARNCPLVLARGSAI